MATVPAIRVVVFLAIHLTLFASPAAAAGSTTIRRGFTSEYGFVETARFPDCGVGGSGAFLNTTAYSRGECGILCLMEGGCLSFEWGESNGTCSLFTYSALPNLRPKFGVVFADSVDPKVGEQHPCDDDPCLSGNICTEECHPHGYKCQCPPGLQGDTCDDLAPVNGGFTRWGNFSECSPVCRAVGYRNCSNPWPVGEGKDCVGHNTKGTDCPGQDCNVFPYIGCYKHSQLDGDYEVSLEASGDDMTIPLCKEVCAYGGFKFAALQGQDCYCIQTMQVSDAFDETQCGTNCPGDSGQTCGDSGSSYSSVYKAGTSYAGTLYIGCFTGTMPSNKVHEKYASDPPPSTTPVSGTSAPSYSGMTAEECIEDCRVDGYRFASMYNATACHCHHKLEGLDTSFEDGACDVPCPGGNAMGTYCGGSAAFSTYFVDIKDTEFWTEWFNFDNPWSDGDDIETTTEVHDTMPYVCDNPVGIECSAFDGTPHDQTGDNFNIDCTVEGGINCTQNLQVYYVNVTFNVSDWRLLDIVEDYNATDLQCIWVNDNTTMINVTMTNAALTNATEANATMVNGTGMGTNGTGMGTNGTGMGTNDTVTDLGYLMCNNQTLSLERNVTINDTFLRLTWRMDKMSPQCQDYQFRLKCKNEPEKMIGCFLAGDVNDTVTTDLVLDVANCSSYCTHLGYPLLALSQDDNACYCGNSMKNNAQFSSQCFYACGTPAYPCGGVGKQSVYYAGDCNLAFGVTKSHMSGTLMHNNDATDDYDVWFDALDQNPTVELSNFTNIGADIPFELEIDLGEIRSFNRMETTGIFVNGISVATGVTEFRVGYKLEPNEDMELVTDIGALTPKEFSVSSVAAITSHAMGQLVTGRYITIYVDDYHMFPGIKLEMYGCSNG